MKYHLHVFGCQMNEADAQRVGSELEKIGLTYTDHAREADVIVLDTCVVRQSAEDKAYSYITTLKPIKQKRPDTIVTVMGCMVGVKGNAALKKQFPWVDVFMAPSETAPLVNFMREREAFALMEQETRQRFALQDGDLILPSHERGKLVAAHVPIVYGCSHACTFCIIPFRRGVERSRPIGEIAHEVRSLAEQGVKEVTLLGQIVDRYGKDFDDGPDLSDLLRVINGIDGIERIRFLTSHPNWMNDKLLDTVAELPKVCEHIEVPVQAGDDEVLRRMKRGYTVRRLSPPDREDPIEAAQHLDRHRHHRGLSGRDRGAVPGDVRSIGRTQTRRGAPGQVFHAAWHGGRAQPRRRRSRRRERAPLAAAQRSTRAHFQA